MIEARGYVIKKSLAIAIVMAAVLWGLILSPTSSSASVSVYCNNTTLSEFNYCHGAPRTMYAVEGWGDQHSVCVWWGPDIDYRCSGGAGVSIYDPFGENKFGEPGIQDNALGSNVVHGRAYQP